MFISERDLVNVNLDFGCCFNLIVFGDFVFVIGIKSECDMGKEKEKDLFDFIC